MGGPGPYLKLAVLQLGLVLCIRSPEELALLQQQRTSTNSATSKVDLVNVLAGTSNVPGGFSHGNTLPIVARPWGFNHWAVQSEGSPYDSNSWWFQPQNQRFVGLRCTHQPSPWIGDYGHFLVFPTVDGSSADSLWYDPQGSTFRPYLLSTQLEDPGVSSGRMGFHMVPTMHGAAFKVSMAAKSGKLAFQLPTGSWQLAEGASYVSGGGVPDGDRQETLFVAVEKTKNTRWTLEGNLAHLTVSSGSTAFVRLATSFISAEQAYRNLQLELGGKSFPGLVAEGQSEWDRYMSRAEVEFAEAGKAKVFYSNLYRTMLFPRFLWEEDAAGRTVHRSAFSGKVEPGHAVTDEGFWDAYRTHYPLLGLLFPDLLGAIVDGWLGAYREKGWLPSWSSYNQRRSMVGTMGDCSIADAIVKSSQGLLSGFDQHEAFEAIYKDATVEPQEWDKSADFGRVALKEYIEKGYAPSDHGDVVRFARDQSAALTLNYNLADACIALAADALGRKADAQMLRERSKSFRRIFDNATRYFRPKRTDGSWDGSLDPISWGNGFTEAAAAQYRFDAPHDVEGLAALMGGRTEFCKNIHNMFESRSDFHVGTYRTVIHEMSEAASLGFGQYAHNNQPVHHVLYVAALGGCRAFAQKTLRRVMKAAYTQDGWSGDEDTGEMSSWYVLSSLGLYSLVPGSDDLVLGSPEVKRARLVVPGRPELEIQAPENSEDHVYVQGVQLNGKALEAAVPYSLLAKSGGRLEFTMSTAPTDSL